MSLPKFVTSVRRSSKRLFLGVLVVALGARSMPVAAQTASWTLGPGNSAFYNSGNVGVGASAPVEKLHVFGNVNGNVGLRFENASAGPFAQSLVFLFNDVGFGTLNMTSSAGGNLFRIQSNSAITGGIVMRTLTAADIQLAPNDATALIVKGNGNVGIGTTAPSSKLHVAGDITLTGTLSGGNVQAKYQDLAEWVPSDSDLAPGTVVVLDPDKSNLVMASAQPYDTRVAGVVSERPGILLGEGGDGKIKVATTGRVQVRVRSDKPVKVGDLLVTSDIAGTAMVSQPIDIAGVQIHRPGTLIGKALEPMPAGTGEILVLLSLQ